MRWVFGCMLGLVLLPSLALAHRIDVPDCVVVEASAIFGGAGFNHLVTVANGCDATVQCEVSTNVDPEPVHELELRPGAEETLVTRRGSPASEFEAVVTCRRD